MLSEKMEDLIEEISNAEFAMNLTRSMAGGAALGAGIGYGIRYTFRPDIVKQRIAKLQLELKSEQDPVNKQKIKYKISKLENRLKNSKISKVLQKVVDAREAHLNKNRS
jgi:hypothetical protein